MISSRVRTMSCLTPSWFLACTKPIKNAFVKINTAKQISGELSSRECPSYAGNHRWHLSTPVIREGVWILESNRTTFESKSHLFYLLEDGPWNSPLNPPFIPFSLLFPYPGRIVFPFSLLPPLLLTCPQAASSRAITEPSTQLGPVENPSKPYLESYF